MFKRNLKQKKIQNDPADVAPWFKSVIEEQFSNEFEKIVFAIYAKNERFIRPFQAAFL